MDVRPRLASVLPCLVTHTTGSVCATWNTWGCLPGGDFIGGPADALHGEIFAGYAPGGDHLLALLTVAAMPASNVAMTLPDIDDLGIICVTVRAEDPAGRFHKLASSVLFSHPISRVLGSDCRASSHRSGKARTGAERGRLPLHCPTPRPGLGRQPRASRLGVPLLKRLVGCRDLWIVDVIEQQGVGLHVGLLGR